MTCQEYQKRLPALLEGDLTGDELAVMERHLQTCPACEEEYALLQRSVHLVRTLEPKPAPAGFNQSLRKRLIAEVAPPWYKSRRFMLAAAASVALLLGSWPWWLSYSLGPDLAGLRMAAESTDDALVPSDSPPEDVAMLADPDLLDLPSELMSLEATLRVSNVDAALLSLDTLSFEVDARQDQTRDDGGYRIILHIPDQSLDTTLQRIEQIGSLAWIPQGRGEAADDSTEQDLYNEYLEAARGWTKALEDLAAAREADLSGDDLAQQLLNVARTRVHLERVLATSSGVRMVIHLIED